MLNTEKKTLLEDALFFLILVFQKFKTGVIGCVKIKSMSYQCKEYVIISELQWLSGDQCVGVCWSPVMQYACLGSNRKFQNQTMSTMRN